MRGADSFLKGNGGHSLCNPIYFLFPPSPAKWHSNGHLRITTLCDPLLEEVGGWNAWYGRHNFFNAYMYVEKLLTFYRTTFFFFAFWGHFLN